MGKKGYVFLTIFFLISTAVFAKDLRAGIEAGTSFSSFIGPTVTYDASLVGVSWNGYLTDTNLTAGVFLDCFITDDLSAELNTSYVRKGSNPTNTVLGDQVHQNIFFDYLEFSLLPKFHFPEFSGLKTAIYVGPSIGFMLDNSKHIYDSSDSIDNTVNNLTVYNSEDYCANFGGEVGFENLFLDFKYQLGLSNVFKKNDGTPLTQVQNQLFAIMLGYYFF